MGWREVLRLGLWWAVAALATVGLGFIVGGRSLVGTYLVVIALLGAAAARLVLPAGKVGGLAIRSRTVDLLTLLALAAALFTAVHLAPLGRP